MKKSFFSYLFVLTALLSISGNLYSMGELEEIIEKASKYEQKREGVYVVIGKITNNTATDINLEYEGKNLGEIKPGETKKLYKTIFLLEQEEDKGFLTVSVDIPLKIKSPSGEIIKGIHFWKNMLIKKPHILRADSRLEFSNRTIERKYLDKSFERIPPLQHVSDLANIEKRDLYLINVTINEPLEESETELIRSEQ